MKLKCQTKKEDLWVSYNFKTSFLCFSLSLSLTFVICVCVFVFKIWLLYIQWYFSWNHILHSWGSVILKGRSQRHVNRLFFSALYFPPLVHSMKHYTHSANSCWINGIKANRILSSGVTFFLTSFSCASHKSISIKLWIDITISTCKILSEGFLHLFTPSQNLAINRFSVIFQNFWEFLWLL